MAAIEKICELSGEYPAHLMYRYKRNHVQIMPHYRINFQGADHVLHIFKPEKRLLKKYQNTKLTSITDDCNETWKNYDPSFKNKEEWMECFNIRYIYDYEYCLEVFDEGLQGKVNGRYINHSTNISTVKRKLKRMLRCRKLNVVYHNCSLHEYFKEDNN
tara:strand:+ start:1114 stop:1590 length:477 start_codon:yes stop_codon:yes gene_type:complete